VSGKQTNVLKIIIDNYLHFLFHKIPSHSTEHIWNIISSHLKTGTSSAVLHQFRPLAIGKYNKVIICRAPSRPIAAHDKFQCRSLHKQTAKTELNFNGRFLAILLHKRESNRPVWQHDTQTTVHFIV